MQLSGMTGKAPHLWPTTVSLVKNPGFIYLGYTIMNIVEIRNTQSYEAEGVLINLWSIKNF